MQNHKPPKVLIVEDQLNWRGLYKVWLRKHCFLTFCRNRSQALQNIYSHPFDVIIMDLGLPRPEDGIQTIKDILSYQPHYKIIVVTSYTDRKLHLLVQQLGAYAVFRKDERLELELPIFIRKAYEMTNLEKENLFLRNQVRETAAKYKILGKSQATQDLHKKLNNVSQTDLSVLITGPTGAGKNYIAKMIHLLSPRYNKPFVAINCANLPPNLVESELFGHVKGAFTGADTTKMGKFKLADGGTILLDEVGELPPFIQAKLLQVIEEKSFYPVGSSKQISVDVRILSSTNKDLLVEKERGNFREDLYFRLTGFTLRIPSLAERKEDIPIYFDYFIEQVCQEEGIPRPEIDSEVYEAIQDLPWPGNLRELKNVVTRLLIFHPQKICVKDLFKHCIFTKNPLLDKAIRSEYKLRELASLYARELYRIYRKKKEVAKIMGIDLKTLNRYLNLKNDQFFNTSEPE